MILLVILLHILIAAIDLPTLWKRPGQRRAFWATLILIVLGLGLAIPVSLRRIPPSGFVVIEGFFKPIGSPLFKSTKGANR